MRTCYTNRPSEYATRIDRPNTRYEPNTRERAGSLGFPMSRFNRQYLRSCDRQVHKRTRSPVVFLLTIQYNLHDTRLHAYTTPNIPQLVRAQRNAMNDETRQAPQDDAKMNDAKMNDAKIDDAKDERRTT